MKYISYVRYALIAISLLIVGLGLGSGDVNAMLVWTEWLFIITGAALVGLSVYSMAQDPKSAGRSMVGLLLVLVVLGVSFAMADTTPIETPVKIFDSKLELLLADTGLYATYFAAAIAALAIAGTEVYNLIKK